MKCIVWLIFVLLLCNLVYSMELPFSLVPVKTDANLFQNFVRIDPDDKKPETLKAKCWIWYDEEYLHVCYETEVDSTFRTGSYNPKDWGAEADFIRVQLITIPQAYYAYAYYAYPMGNLYDSIRNTDMSFDSQWNSSYDYTTNVTDSLWTGQINIPFKELRFKAKPPYNWKVIFANNRFKTQEIFSMPYCNIKDGKDYFLEAADITLTHKIKASRDWKIKPYYVKSYDLITKTQTFDPEHIGLDFSFNPGTKTKFKATVNPDYSDVPPDDAQNSYNDRYPAMNWESRYFFTEDIDAFGVDYAFFYTRNIVQPRFAFKLTGNKEETNYGILGAWDKKITENGSVANRDDYYQVLSIIPSSRKIKLSNILLSRMNKDYYNHVPIVSLKWEFLPKVFLHTTLKGSFKKQNDKFTRGMDNNVAFEAEPGNWVFEASYGNKLKDVAIDMGNMYYEDYDFENLNMSAAYNSETKDAYLRSWSVCTYGSTGWRNKPGHSLWSVNDGKINHRIKYGGKNIGAYSNLDFKSKHSLYVGTYTTTSEYAGRHYDQNNATFSYSINKWDNMGIGCTGCISKDINYKLNKTCQYTSFGGRIWINATKKLSTSIGINNHRYNYPGHTQIVNYPDTTDVFQDRDYNITTASLSYNMNLKTSWRNGLSFSTYRTPEMKPYLSFYSNLEYEFKPDWFVYLGYKTQQFQLKPSNSILMNENFYRYSASAYLKVSATI